MLLALAVAVVALAAPVSARAGEAMLWACHGPDGRPLPPSFEASSSGGAFVRPTSPVPCPSPSDTIKVGFDNASPPEGSTALLRFVVPGPGTTLEGVWLGRTVTGPGYFARTSSGELETYDGSGPLGGVFEHAASGSWVELGLRCAARRLRHDRRRARLQLDRTAGARRPARPPSPSTRCPRTRRACSA